MEIGKYIDRAIGIVAPGIAFKRSFNRARMNEMQGRSYDGATDGRRNAGWNSRAMKSANQIIAKDHKNLVIRSRELAINNPYAKRAPYLIANNVVGTGMLATISISDTIEKGRIRKTPRKKELQQLFAVAWKDWAEKLSADYDGNFNFYGLQHLALRTIIVSGEVLVVRRLCDQTVNKYGFQVLILEGDYIDVTKDTDRDKDGGYTFRGVKYDANNKRIGYWIFDRHPSEAYAKSSFYKIEDVIHVYDVERSGQNRGVPLPASTITSQKDLGDYMGAELLGKKAASCFAAVVTKEADPDGDDKEGEEFEELQPGAFHYMNPGEQIHFPSLPQNPGLDSFVKVNQRGIAAGYMVPYENLTGDLSNVTFISGRLGQLDFKKQVEYWQHTMFIPKFCDRVFQWFVKNAKIFLTIEDNVEVVATWTAPRREMMDPTKEVAAMRDEVRAGFASWSEKIRENGYDPEQVLEEMKKDQQLFEAAGLMPNWTQYFELMAKVKMNTGKDTKPQESGKE